MATGMRILTFIKQKNALYSPEVDTNRCLFCGYININFHFCHLYR
jgi:hypothetical protein